MNNLTFTSFLLFEFSVIRNLQILYFFIFLALYMITLIGNLLITAAVAIDYHLHTPMYFFLMNLAMTDLGIVSVTIPKLMTNYLMSSRSISYSGCVAQVFFYLFFATCDFTLLIVMAHDRHVAICNPLQYEKIMHKGACICLAAATWTSSLLNATIQTGTTFATIFCSNYIKQFFCEIPQLLKLSCCNCYLPEFWILVIVGIIIIVSFMYIILTYVKIFAAVLRIPSVNGQKKALSTCLPHLVVISVFMFSGLFTYGRTYIEDSCSSNVIFSVLYTIIPPMLNQFIYSVRNKEIKAALYKWLHLDFLI
ncbi:olfactory receptor 14I1-like [Notechis scutatus]|uniref:Olfactory receptor 14I1-like n=1 Tax=Notechis scutatus TaxID=8663 RepID=A0A6J1VNX7_9SAUR|nr:olfactory receptor 14I1-like [Notechis scutatus]